MAIHTHESTDPPTLNDCYVLRKLIHFLAVLTHYSRLWTTFDTSSTRKSVSLTSLKQYLRRSKHTLDKAIVSTRAQFDIPKMQYLSRTCQELKYLEVCGSGVIGDTLVSALPLAKSLGTIICGAHCEISLSSVQSILKITKNTLSVAAFLRVKGSRAGFTRNLLAELQSLKTLNLRSSGAALLDLVSCLQHAII